MKNIAQEFKTFIMRGNVMDLAIGIVIGTAFTKIVSSLVDDIVMPLLGIFKKYDLSYWMIGQVKLGMFLNNIINFIIVSFAVFMIIKVLNRLSRRQLINPEVEMKK